jgi:hypothetical protein
MRKLPNQNTTQNISEASWRILMVIVKQNSLGTKISFKM